MNWWGLHPMWMVKGYKKGGVCASKQKWEVFKNRVDDCKLTYLGFVSHKFIWQCLIYHEGSGIYKRLEEGYAMKFGESKIQMHFDLKQNHFDLKQNHLNNQSLKIFWVNTHQKTKEKKYYKVKDLRENK